MAARITNIIPTQAFEVVRDLIGAILKLELENQKTLQLEAQMEFDEDINVYVGRLTPFNYSEQLMINVSLDSANYQQQHEKGVHGSTNYFIDIYVSGEESEDEDGGFNSTNRRDRFIGMIRYILQDHNYKTLGLPAGIIMSSGIDGFETLDPREHEDTSFISMARMTFSTRINETQSLASGIEINTIFTDIKLSDTNHGYKLEFTKTN